MEALDLQQGYVSPEAIQFSFWLCDTFISAFLNTDPILFS